MLSKPSTGPETPWWQTGSMASMTRLEQLRCPCILYPYRQMIISGLRPGLRSAATGTDATRVRRLPTCRLGASISAKPITSELESWESP